MLCDPHVTLTPTHGAGRSSIPIARGQKPRLDGLVWQLPGRPAPREDSGARRGTPAARPERLSPLEPDRNGARCLVKERAGGVLTPAGAFLRAPGFQSPHLKTRGLDWLTLGTPRATSPLGDRDWRWPGAGEAGNGSDCPAGTRSPVGAVTVFRNQTGGLAQRWEHATRHTPPHHVLRHGLFYENVVSISLSSLDPRSPCQSAPSGLRPLGWGRHPRAPFLRCRGCVPFMQGRPLEAGTERSAAPSTGAWVGLPRWPAVTLGSRGGGMQVGEVCSVSFLVGRRVAGDGKAARDADGCSSSAFPVSGPTIQSAPVLTPSTAPEPAGAELSAPGARLPVYLPKGLIQQ